jgi:3-deoxy-D-manno-octulosonic-acid transferase
MIRAALWRTLYSTLWRLLTPLIWIRIWRRSKREPVYGLFPGERFGIYRRALPSPAQAGYSAAPVWVHAVSLGETRAAQPLITALLDRGLPVLLTHMTATGRTEGMRLFQREIDQGRLRQVWLPYDMPGAVRRFFRYFTPRCGLLIETEVWPNLVKAAKHYDVPVALVSARLSEKSMRSNLRMASLARQTFGGLDAVLAQTQEDADRLVRVGARAPKVVGNLKFDLSLPTAQLDAGLAWNPGLARPVVALASTREGEEPDFLQAILAAPRTADGVAPLVVLIPRHPQRFDEVAELVRAAGLAMIRRSSITGLPKPSDVPPETQLLLGDSLGEMPFYYAAADVTIIGGSFAPLGGQNLIEASACGVPVILGPHTFNFAEASENAIAAGAALRAQDAANAWQLALSLLENPAERALMRQAAASFSATHTGATRRVMFELSRWLA